MPPNTSPIFPVTPRVTWVAVSGSNALMDGTGTVNTVFTAQVSGSRLDYVIAIATGSNNATVARFFLNNGGVGSAAANNALIYETTLPTTAYSNAVPTGPQINIPFNMSLPSGSRLNVSLSTAVSGGWEFTAFGGDY